MLKLIIGILLSLITGITAVLFFAEKPDTFQIETLKTLSLISASIIFVCFILSELTDNYSQTDKIWSIAPVIYTWTISYTADFQPRLVLMSVLITIWGIRLSYNFGRMGGYSWKFWTGHEDYRWKIVRRKPGLKHPVAWHTFNLLFIAGYQNILILLITLPVLASYNANDQSLNITDYLLGIVIIALIIVETVADQQQYNYQKEKKKRTEQNKPLTDLYTKGFVHTGLWRISRHPNYFAEQAIWVMIFLFSVNATGNWGNFSIIGCLLLIILFQGSSWLSESISSEKYTEYKEYQQKTGKFFPKIIKNKKTAV